MLRRSALPDLPAELVDSRAGHFLTPNSPFQRSPAVPIATNRYPVHRTLRLSVLQPATIIPRTVFSLISIVVNKKIYHYVQRSVVRADGLYFSSVDRDVSILSIRRLSTKLFDRNSLLFNYRTQKTANIQTETVVYESKETQKTELRSAAVSL